MRPPPVKHLRLLLAADSVAGDEDLARHHRLDQVLHHAVTINIRGDSYRLKDKLKAGLLGPAN